MIVDAVLADAPEIAGLAAARRKEYAEAQPVFWREAVGAVEAHLPYLESLISATEVISLVCRGGDRLDGYVFASVTDAPPVYDPGGPTGFIDDFAVAEPELWDTVGADLLRAARARLGARGAAQVVVVTGHHDRAKRGALAAAGLGLATEWWVAPLSGQGPASR